MLGWGLALLAGSGIFACSDEGATPRATAGTGGQVGVSGASGASGSAGTGGGGASGGVAGSGGTAASLNLGDVLELVAATGEVPYAIGENPYGIVGGAFLARSTLGNTITVGDTPGEICISGNLEEVPNGNYNQYWGVEIGFNLNQLTPGGNTPDPADAGADGGNDASAPSAPSADAGAAPNGDASAPTPDVAAPWQPGRVIGFSYVIEGAPINLIRFKALPAGYDRELEASVYCKSVEASSGAAENSLFTEMTQYCWSTGNPQLPIGGGLDNISWQLPADVAPAGERPFDWCLKELRPILAE
jgi:hypothetical protein